MSKCLKFSTGILHIVAAMFFANFGVAVAATIRVGPGADVASISEAAKLAKSGDTVEIQAGEWHGDVALWENKDVTIRGVGGRPVLHAAGRSVEGKGIWVFRHGRFIVENIEFRDARVSDGNGAGIRLESGKLRVVKCHFLNNQSGILTSNDDTVELEIESSLFAEAPDMVDPPPHLIYVGRIAFVKITGSRFHKGHVGHLIKSRAKVSEISYNLIFDGPGGTASYEIDLPDGGIVRLIGNVVGQSATSENYTMIAYGAEGVTWERNSLLIAHNTLLSEGVRPAWFIRVWKNKVPANFKTIAVNNLYSGIGLFNYGLSGSFEGNWLIPKSVINDAAMLDFRIAESSVIRHVARVVPTAGSSDIPLAEFKLPLGIRQIMPGSSLLPGAFQ